MVRSPVLTLASLLGLVVSACPKSDPRPPGDADADGDTDADTDADGDGDRDASPDGPSHPDGGIGFHLGTYQLELPVLTYEPNYPGAPSATLRSCEGAAIKVVTSGFAEALAESHRGYLEDGRVVEETGTLEGGGPCYAVLDPGSARWGTGSYGRALEPFRSVFIAPEEAPDGRWLYVPQLYGLEMPGEERGLSFRHDGCVRVDDAGVTGNLVALWAVLPSYADEIRVAVGIASVDLYQDSDYCPGQL